jgi:hypothetical protein
MDVALHAVARSSKRTLKRTRRGISTKLERRCAMNKHTPGPWKIAHPYTTEWDGCEIQFGSDGECVTDYVYSEADAKLIAAAPEMLEALEEILNLEIKHMGDYWSGDEGYDVGDVQDLCKAAIGKAKGESNE